MCQSAVFTDEVNNLKHSSPSQGYTTVIAHVRCGTSAATRAVPIRTTRVPNCLRYMLSRRHAIKLLTDRLTDSGIALALTVQLFELHASSTAMEPTRRLKSK